MKRSVANLPETTDTMPFADDGLSKTSEEEEGSGILRRMSASSAAEAWWPAYRTSGNRLTLLPRHRMSVFAGDSKAIDA